MKLDEGGIVDPAEELRRAILAHGQWTVGVSNGTIDTHNETGVPTLVVADGFLVARALKYGPAVLAELAERRAAMGDADGWIPIDRWTPEHGETVMGYWQYRDQAGRLTEGWGTIENSLGEWEDWEGIHPRGVYTHFKPLSRPKGVKP